MSILDMIILLTLIIGLWQGFNHGLLRSLVSLFGWFLALLLATYFAKPMSVYFIEFLDSSILSTVAAFLAVALFVIVGLQFILWIMSKTLQGLKLSLLDKLAGAIFGCGKNLLIILLVLSVLAPFVSQRNFWQHSQIAQALLPFAPFAQHFSQQIAKTVSNSANMSLQKLDNLSVKP